MTQASKIVHEWNGHLEIFSLREAIENSRQYLLVISKGFLKHNNKNHG